LPSERNTLGHAYFEKKLAQQNSKTEKVSGRREEHEKGVRLRDTCGGFTAMPARRIELVQKRERTPGGGTISLESRRTE